MKSISFKALVLLVVFCNEVLTASGCRENGGDTVDIYEMHVKSRVRNRFARTMVTSKVRNCAIKAKQATFSLMIPQAAFISGFVMEVGGTNYTAYVEERYKAMRTYDEAVASGRGAGHVATAVRNANEISISVHVEPNTVAAFYLKYEELLIRQDGHYELVINLHPGQLVPDLTIEVEIKESKRITNLKVPAIRSGKQIASVTEFGLANRAFKQVLSGTSGVVGFSPNIIVQKRMANILKTPEEEGFAGQFVVQYDVERDRKGGPILVKDGYFVHFFSPKDLKRIAKHVVFVLDTSESMENGNKMEQLKQAMYTILDELNDDDIFHLVEFNTDVHVWVLDVDGHVVPYRSKYAESNMDQMMNDRQLYQATSISSNNIKNAKVAVCNFKPEGLTDINTALRTSLYLIQLTKITNTKDVVHQPMVIFLTDGNPAHGVTSTEQIIKNIAKLNMGFSKTPIFALSFGKDADKGFLKKLSLSNAGFPKHIYEAADAALQLENFYKEMSSPTLSNVAFRYDSSSMDVTETDFPLHFQGSELVTAGRYESNDIQDSHVEAWNGESERTFKPNVQKSSTSIERLWAYLTIKQLLNNKELPDADQEDMKKEIIDLALRYSFVTPLTSLVVVKPEQANIVNIQDDSEAGGGATSGSEEATVATSVKPVYDIDVRGSSCNYHDTSKCHYVPPVVYVPPLPVPVQVDNAYPMMPTGPSHGYPTQAQSHETTGHSHGSEPHPYHEHYPVVGQPSYPTQAMPDRQLSLSNDAEPHHHHVHYPVVGPPSYPPPQIPHGIIDHSNHAEPHHHHVYPGREEIHYHNQEHHNHGYQGGFDGYHGGGYGGGYVQGGQVPWQTGYSSAGGCVFCNPPGGDYPTQPPPTTQRPKLPLGMNGAYKPECWSISSKGPKRTGVSPVYSSGSALTKSTRIEETLENSPTLLINLVDKNGGLNLPTGKHSLGLRSNVTRTISCSNSLLNSEGHCSLLQKCLKEGLFIHYDDYIDHSCMLTDTIAGICCPDTWYKR